MSMAKKDPEPTAQQRWEKEQNDHHKKVQGMKNFVQNLEDEEAIKRAHDEMGIPYPHDKK